MYPFPFVAKFLMGRRLLAVLAAAVITLGYGEAYAYLVLKPTLSTTNSFDDNPRLLIEDANDLVFTANEVRLESTYVRPTYELGITPKFRLSRYTKEPELDTEEYFVSTFANKVFERHQIGVAFDFENEASFATERDDSGLFNVNLFRTTLNGRINWTYLLNERVTFLFNAYISDVSFEEDPNSRFIDFFSYGANASVNYRISESTSLWVILNRTDFKTPQLSSNTESYSLQLGFDHQLDETTDVSFRIGQNRSNLEFKQSQLVLLSLNPLVIGTVLVDQEENQSGDITQLIVEKEFSKANLRMNWDRRFAPSSLGARQEIEEVGGFLRYRLTQLNDITASVRYRNRIQEGSLNTTRLNGLEIFDYGARLRHRLTRTVSAELGYRYREQTNIAVGITAESHRVFFVLRYQPNELRFW